MNTILGKKHYRRSFYTIVILALVLAVVVRFLGLPYLDDQLSVGFLTFCAILLDGFVVSFIVTVFIGSYIFWLSPELVRESEMDVVEPKEIGPLLSQALTDTRKWVYKGACGRYTRATTLPRLAKAARHKGIGRDVRIVILDPADDQLCEAYATYRRSLKSANPNDPWTANRVKEEVLATIVTAFCFKHEEPLLTIDLFLINHFSAFRLDISDRYVVVTKEDKEAAGLRADANTYFYDSYVDDVRLSERQGKEVRFNEQVPAKGRIQTTELKKVIIDAELLPEAKLEELDLDLILNAVSNPKDPYS
ncbi:MAG: hypothetical protein AAGD11_02315 [Planctomycetota bacterium]